MTSLENFQNGLDDFRRVAVEEAETSVRTEMAEKDIQISRLKGKVVELVLLIQYCISRQAIIYILSLNFRHPHHIYHFDLHPIPILFVFHMIIYS